MLLATLAFWVVNMWHLPELFEGVFQTGRWPIGIYPTWLRFSVTFLVPIAFAVTVPAEAVTSRLEWQTLALAAGFAVVFFAHHALVLALRPQELHRRVGMSLGGRRADLALRPRRRAGGRSSTSTAPRSTGSGRSSRRVSRRSMPRAARAACSCRISAGLDVDGCDISPDMLERVRERCEREGLPAPNLYAQAMHELDLPRRYRTIVVCGGLGLGGGGVGCRWDGEPGGTLVADNEVPYAQTWLWKYCLKERAQCLAAAVARQR